MTTPPHSSIEPRTSVTWTDKYRKVCPCEICYRDARRTVYTENDLYKHFYFYDVKITDIAGARRPYGPTVPEQHCLGRQ